MPTIAGPAPYEPPSSGGMVAYDSSMVSPALNGAKRRSQNTSQTSSPAPDARSREKGKQKPTHLRGLSIENAASATPPAAERDSQTNTYLLPVPAPTISSNDSTPTAASMKSAPRPPARSPLRQSQNLSPHPKAIEPPNVPGDTVPGEFSLPIPRLGKDESEAARKRRREAYKSGMSFVSLYELYSDPPPPLPVPPVPALEKTKMSDAAPLNRARSGSTASLGGSRERKGSASGVTPAPTSSSSHIRPRSGSIGGSQSRGPTNQTLAPGDVGSSSQYQDPPTSVFPKALAPASMSSSVNPISSNPGNFDEPPDTGPSKTKRQHVLFEILETERIYSSDMALVRAVHLPLALGMKVDLGPMGSRSTPDQPNDLGPSRSSGVSTNTTNSAISQSGSSGPGVPDALPNEPPMSVDDAKVIFANLDELAEFSGKFTEFIQLALGAEIDGGEGPDKIGELFLQMLPIMQPIYETYITKHSASIARLTTLTTENPTKAMLNYIEHTKAIASTHSNSWDLNSLLIKPIQRFLKYPLLLDTLVASTPDDHPDKPNLIKSKGEMVRASKFVNEQTQKVEICRTILQRKPLKGLSAVFSTGAPDAKQLKVKGSKSVFAVTKSKDPSGAGTPSPSVTPFDAAFDPIQLENRLVEHASGGASGLEDLIKHLQGFETVLPVYMRDVVTWVRSVRDTLTRLEKWAIAFERVIALDETPGIEALDAFRGVLTDRLSPMLDGLETAIRNTLAPTLTKIQDTMRGPTLLLNTAASLRTVHNQLMNTPYHGKNSRPSAQMIEGSKTYLALMQQLRTDLPVYVRHMDRMFSFVIMQVAKWQERWYREVGNAWGDLWKALEVGPGNRKEYRTRRAKEIAHRRKKGQTKPYPEPGEAEDQQRGAYGCSGDETVAIWWDRWEEVQGTINALGVPSGAALQGVRSLQGLIKTPNLSGPNNQPMYASDAAPRSGSVQDRIIHEEEEEDPMPPGYYPAMPAMPRRSTRPSIQTPPSTSSNSQGMPSPVSVHPVNNFLPAVSPGPSKKERPSLKTKTASFPRSSTAPVSPIEYDPSSSDIHSLPRAGNPRDRSISDRNRSQERAPLRKKSDPAQFKGTPPLRSSPAAPDFDEDMHTSGSRTVPRGSSFRKRLSENIWVGDSTTRPRNQGLDVNTDELEAASRARKEREAELGAMGERRRALSNGSVSLQRHTSSGSSHEPPHRRRTSDATEGGPSSSHSRLARHSSSTRRQRPSVDIPRQALSEYSRNLGPKLDTTGHRVLGEDAPVLFTCTAVAAFQPKRNFKYRGLPFLQLEIGDIVNITKDAGRPSQHPELEAVVSDGVDTLFIGTRLPDGSEEPQIGWLWASFVMPFDT